MKFQKDEIIELYWSKDTITLEDQKDKILSLYGTIADKEKFVYRIIDGKIN